MPSIHAALRRPHVLTNMQISTHLFCLQRAAILLTMLCQARCPGVRLMILLKIDNFLHLSRFNLNLYKNLIFTLQIKLINKFRPIKNSALVCARIIDQDRRCQRLAPRIQTGMDGNHKRHPRRPISASGKKITRYCYSSFA